MEHALVISSHLKNINKVRNFLEEVYNEACLNKNSFFHVFLGISEAVNNSIVHGNKLDCDKKVFLNLELKTNKLQIEITDEGEGFSEDILFDPTVPENIRKEWGRGIFLIRQVADELVFKDNGRKVLILFTLPE